MQVCIRNLFVTLLNTSVTSPKAMCKCYSIYCVVSLPKLHLMRLVSASLLVLQTVPQQGRLTVRSTLRTDFQRRRLKNSEVGAMFRYLPFF